MGVLGRNFCPPSLSRASTGQGLISNQEALFRGHPASTFPEAELVSRPSPHASRLNSGELFSIKKVQGGLCLLHLSVTEPGMWSTHAAAQRRQNSCNF